MDREQLVSLYPAPPLVLHMQNGPHSGADVLLPGVMADMPPARFDWPVPPPVRIWEIVADWLQPMPVERYEYAGRIDDHGRRLYVYLGRY
jgi:hypothetical protein